ncbi:hypothetical protein AAVH_29020 [Aphelenchoides avenae]|nr:hypothetical protein AAVH_37148 [Aphelenchus avenae]KAH7703800.1 hypothetical protein AAVH_29020 [Aphelenchus avenae]
MSKLSLLALLGLLAVVCIAQDEQAAPAEGAPEAAVEAGAAANGTDHDGNGSNSHEDGNSKSHVSQVIGANVYRTGLDWAHLPEYQVHDLDPEGQD